MRTFWFTAATVIRLIDALKTFDTIYVMTLGKPGPVSETLNTMLYQTAFAHYELSYGSAIVAGLTAGGVKGGKATSRLRLRHAIAHTRFGQNDRRFGGICLDLLP